MKLYAEDIDKNGSVDPVMFYYIKDEDGKRKLYPSINKDQLAAQAPIIKKQFLLNKDYATATADKIFSNDKNLQVLTCNETRSCWIENKGVENLKCMHCPGSTVCAGKLLFYVPIWMAMVLRIFYWLATNIKQK
jgi:hypothetical protein